MRSNSTYHIEETDDATAALEELEDGDVALRGVLEDHVDVWVLCPTDEGYLQVNVAEERATRSTPSSTKLILKQRERVEVVPIDDAPSGVRDAAAGRDPGQGSLGAFGNGNSSRLDRSTTERESQ